MIAFITLFFPSIISVGIYESLSNRNIRIKEFIYRFCTYNVLINFICFGIKRFITNTSESSMYSLATDMTPKVAFNYLIIAIPCAILVALINILISNNTDIKVEEN